MAFDVMNIREIDNLPAQLPAEFAEVDILVNNAGLALGLEPIQSIDMKVRVGGVGWGAEGIGKLFHLGCILLF